MSKLTKVGVAAVLGLMCILSAFSSGVFAQSVKQSTAHAVAHKIVALEQDLRGGEHWTGNHEPGDNWQGNNWNRNCGWRMNCRWRTWPTRCVRVVKWIGWGRTAHPVVYWACRR
jgi:hypothetical protein